MIPIKASSTMAEHIIPNQHKAETHITISTELSAAFPAYLRHSAIDMKCDMCLQGLQWLQCWLQAMKDSLQEKRGAFQGRLNKKLDITPGFPGISSKICTRKEHVPQRALLELSLLARGHIDIQHCLA